MPKIYRYSFNIICLTFLINFSYAQKPPIDFSIINSWPEIVGPTISNDGHYVSYLVDNKSSRTLYIQSIDSSFRRIIAGFSLSFIGARFSEDSRSIIFKNSGDSLVIIDLITRNELYIPQCNSFKMPQNGTGRWLACLLKNKDVELYNLFSGEVKLFHKVLDFTFSPSGNLFLMQTTAADVENKYIYLQCVTTATNKIDTIWQGSNCSSYSFDKLETKIAFIGSEKINNSNQSSIYYYCMGMSKANFLVEWNTKGIDSTWVIKNNNLRFSPNGDKLFFFVSKMPGGVKKYPYAASVDIWNYKDKNLQEEQLQLLSRNVSYLCVIGLKDNTAMILNQDGDYKSVLNEGGNYNYLSINRAIERVGRRESDANELCLINTNNFSRKCIEVTDFHTRFSPSGKYLYWYDRGKKDYYVYNLKTKSIINITKKIQFPIYNEFWDGASLANPQQPEPAWLENDEAILIYDHYDIWKVDPTGIQMPVNITNGYGRKRKILLRFLNEYQNVPELLVINKKSKIILCGFNEVNKRNSFFELKYGNWKDPEELSVHNSVYYFPMAGFWPVLSPFLKKAKNADIYLLTSESSTEYPNLVITKDFKKFTSVSDLRPNKDFNWLTSELYHWKAFDGRPAAGILYKPENFDPKKKYPVIFYFYEKLSDGLNKFLMPELCIGPINIPHFVSRGYLVFCPDIHYTLGDPGKSAFNYVISAAKMLSQKPWVNAKKMGIQGHSFGGYEVNYLVTQTRMFAAAVSASGTTDLISGYGTLSSQGSEGQYYTEFAQSRMVVTLWKDKNRYINNSPLFYADKVTTPLLIMHNKSDQQVPWGQGVEFFTALRRLKKGAWMLQYDEKWNGHVISDQNNKIDYTTRLFQFFDHYLKDMPAPIWMTKGVSAKQKGIVDGLDYDYSTSCEESCQICKHYRERENAKK